MSSLTSIIRDRAEKLQINLYHLSDNNDSLTVFEKECVLDDIETIRAVGLVDEAEQLSSLIKLISVRNSVISKVLYVD